MALSPEFVPHQTDIAIIGAGPQALTLVTHLLQKRKRMQGRFIVLDPSGSWMHQWQHQFAALEIPHLRSPAVHHPDPNPYALRRLAESRQNELLPPYDLPGTRLFQDFCFDVIRRWQLEDKVLRARVRSISPLDHRLRPRFRIGLESGHSVIARRVILAAGSSTPQLPDWVCKIQSPYPQDRLCHSHQIDLRGLQLAREQVLIVGGGAG